MVRADDNDKLVAILAFVIVILAGAFANWWDEQSMIEAQNNNYITSVICGGKP